MKLYKFSLFTWRGTKVSREVLEVEEKPKTYMTVNERWKTRISKSDIGVLSGYDNSTLYLLEDDMEKAKSIFAESLKYKIEMEKEKIERYKNKIAEYENGITVLLYGEKDGYCTIGMI